MDTLHNMTIHLAGMQFVLIDVLAFVYFLLLWTGYSWYASSQYDGRTNLIRITDDMRIQWMRQILKRETRIMDSTLVGNLLRSISFFANTSIFILIGLVTVLGYRDTAVETIQTIPFAIDSSALMWELKVFNLAIIFIYAFFKFTWSLRQYNYCCILIGAAPMPNEDVDNHENFALRAGNMIANASRHFNMGVRAYYFGLAAISWFLHPILFMILTSLFVLIIYRREFCSKTMENLAGLRAKN